MNTELAQNDRVNHVTVALDVDGVVCPVVSPAGIGRASRQTGWDFTVLPDVMFGVMVAKPLIQTLHEIGDQPQAEVLWHTSWWLEAPRTLAPALGLPHLAGDLDRMFATREEFHGSDPDVAPWTWWKLAAVERWLREHPMTADGTHDLLVWVDDDISDAVASGEISPALQNDPRLVMISPDLQTGIKPGELALLRSLTRLG